MKGKKIFLFIVFFCVSRMAIAQVWEIGAQLGGAGYIGDINPNKLQQVSGASIGVFGKINLDPYWALGLHMYTGKIKAFDSNSANVQQRMRNLSFHNTLNEIGLQVDFNFFDYFSGGGFKKITPYLYTGVGAVFFNPKTKYNGQEYELPLYNTEGIAYKKYAFTMPYGAGVKYNITGYLTILGNIGYRNAYTDYLDDVSGKYPGSNAFDLTTTNGTLQYALSDRSGEINGTNIGSAGSQRGDFRKRDTYMLVGIGITYTFVSQKCY